MKCLVCNTCGTPFMSHKKSLFCSEECRDMYNKSIYDMVNNLNRMLVQNIKIQAENSIQRDECSIKCERNGLVYSFSSVQKCAEFLSAQLHYAVNYCRYLLNQQPREIGDWKLIYEE